MKILFDTNIIIPREDNRELAASLQELMQKVQQKMYEICIHPSSMKDVENDPDQKRRQIIVSKLKSYPELKSPPSYKEDEEFKNQIRDFKKLSSNGFIDLDLFYALYRNAVSYLITEDKQIHRWARMFAIESCYTVQEALDFFSGSKKDSDPLQIPLIHKKPLHNLRLEDPFFDSLKEDYSKNRFENWFKTKSREGKEAYVSFDKEGGLNAFLLLKEKKGCIICKPSHCYKENILKISTLKVSVVGNKLGERFLSIAFQHAIRRKIDEIYLTHFVSGPNDRLVKLINDFGFIKSDKYKEHKHRDDPEPIFFKRLCPAKSVKIHSAEELRTTYFPSFYDGDSTKKFIVPIKTKWHDRLFLDQRKQTLLSEFDGKFLVEGNSIKKAYLCRSNSKQIRAGDILLFYKSCDKPNDEGEIRVIGTVDEIRYNVDSVDSVHELVAKRTVYKWKEIEELINRGPLTVILFRYHFPLPKPLSLETLRKEKLIKGPPQSITKIDEERYLKLKKISEIPPKFAISEFRGSPSP